MAIYEQLAPYEVKLEGSHFGQQTFFPVNCLDKEITRPNISSQLSFRTRVFHRGLFEDILRDAKKIFAILVLTGKPRAIRDIVKAGLTDKHLPLSIQENQGRTRTSVLVSKRDGTQFDFSAFLDAASIRHFHKEQWAVQAPIFDIRGQHVVLDAECPLPLTTCDKMDAPGQVYKATIHSAHVRGELSYEGGSDFPVAIKVLEKTDSFELEKENLERIQGLDHKHLIKHIATCTKSPTNFLIFPLANGGNLGQFWVKQDTNRTRDLASWSLHQMLGLVGALAALHGKNCRHGDLKPENILLFKGDTQSQDMLVISDVGVSKFHNQATQLRSQPTKTKATTPIYEAPEIDDPADPRSRRWDLWSAGCMFLEYIVWLLYGHKVMDDFRQSRVSDDPKIYTGSFYRRAEAGEDPVHLQVNRAFEVLRNDPCCRVGTALGGVVGLISDHLLVRLDERADAEMLYGELEAIVRKCEQDESYLRADFDSETAADRFLAILRPVGS